MNTRTRRLLVVLAAPAAALLLWTAAVPLAGVDLAVVQAPQTVGPAMVVLAALLAGLAGWGLLAVLERFTAHGTRTWTVIACTVLLVSLFGPLGAANAAAVLVLLGMHLLVGAVLIGGVVLTGSARR